MVSVVIPVYNVEKYLVECIDSVLNQTYADFELILVDDGSTDSSGEICDKYATKNSRIKVIHRENGGLSVARNTGIQASHGEYIYFLDSDDYIREDTLEKAVCIALKTDSDFVFFEAQSFFDGLNEQTSEMMEYDRSKDYGVMSGSSALLELCNNMDFYPSVPLHFFKRRFLIKQNLQFYPGILHEDNLFTITAFVKAEKVAHINEKLYFRRIRPNSIMGTKFNAKNFQGYYICVRELLKQYAICGENSEEKKGLKVALSFLSTGLVDHYYLLTKDEQKKCHNEFENLDELLARVDYFGKRKMKFKLKHSFLMSRYIFIRSFGK